MEEVQLSPTIGVELHGVNLSHPLRDHEINQIRGLFSQRHLLLVRDQELSHEDLGRFIELFGPIVRNSDGSPLVTVVSNVSPDDITGGGALLYHQDEVTLATNLDEVPLAIAMYAVDVADDAVPTIFADAVRVAEELPVELRERLENTTAVHVLDRSPNRDYAHRTLERDLPENPDPTRYWRAEHPVFYDTGDGRRVVFVTEHQTSHIVGMSHDESEATLKTLYENLYAEDNLFTHHWRNGDILIWNNRALHHARPVRGDARRHILRISVGRKSFYQDDPSGGKHRARHTPSPVS